MNLDVMNFRLEDGAADWKDVITWQIYFLIWILVINNQKSIDEEYPST